MKNKLWFQQLRLPSWDTAAIRQEAKKNKSKGWAMSEKKNKSYALTLKSGQIVDKNRKEDIND